MHERTKRLRDLMAAHQLTAQDVAEMTGRNPQTVRMWRTQKTVRVIPENTLALLALKLGEAGAVE